MLILIKYQKLDHKCDVTWWRSVFALVGLMTLELLTWDFVWLLELSCNCHMNKENGVQVMMVMFSRNHLLTWITKHHLHLTDAFYKKWVTTEDYNLDNSVNLVDYSRLVILHHTICSISFRILNIINISVQKT